MELLVRKIISEVYVTNGNVTNGNVTNDTIFGCDDTIYNIIDRL